MAARTAASMSSGEALSLASLDMCDQGDLAVWRDHQRAAELAGVADRAGLHGALAGAGQRALGDHLGVEQVAHTAGLRPRGLKAHAILVGEHGKLDPLAPAAVRGL